MEERQIAVLLEEAWRRRQLGDWKGAIDLTRRALSIDPDHARAHSALALALLGARRLHGARIEAGAGLLLDGNDAWCHYAMAAVLLAERELDRAWEHCLVALETEVEDVDAYVLGAHIRVMRHELDEARELLDRALELEPAHADALTELARLELRVGRIEAAARRIDEALRAAPGYLEAHVVAGFVALRRGDVADAEGHAKFALTQDATDQGALELWTAIKARRSKTLGMWWRLNAFVSMRSERGQIAMLIGSFVIVRLAIILAGAAGYDGLEDGLSWAWMGFCAYTWYAPAMFRRMLQRDLDTVTLRRDF